MADNDTEGGEEAAAPAPAGEGGGGFPVVGIGASAGGLEALEELLHHLPADTGMAFVVVTHQHPDHTSLLPEILSRASVLPVEEAADGVRVAPDRVFVAAPGGHLALMDGALQRMGTTEEKDSPRLPIDSFLRTLAGDCRERAVCIILSGTGSDGTLGLRAVKSAGGMAMVEEPQAAKYAGMPSSAIATGLADFVLAPADMPERLAGYVAGAYVQDAEARAVATELPAAPVKKILTLLRHHTSHDFSAYKPNTVRRRIQRRMSVHQIEAADQYVRFLQQQPQEIDLLFRDLLISVTNFFRDPRAWQALESRLEALVRGRQTDSPVRVWVPACATGEEAYSVAILLREMLDRLESRPEVQIFGTDLDDRAIDIARAGEYPDGIRADVTPARLERFFTCNDDRYRVRKEIREMVIFASQDAIKDPPFTRLDLVCVRNLLIYLNHELQKKLLPIFHYALKPGGLLFLGTSETVGAFDELFEPLDREWKIYRRREGVASGHGPPELPVRDRARGPAEPRGESATAAGQGTSLVTHIERVLLRRFAPASVVVNGHGEIVHVHGRTGSYLEPSEGQPRNHVLEMAREGLRSALASGLHQAVTQEREVVMEDVLVRTNGAHVQVCLVVVPLTEPEALRGLVLVSFEPPRALQGGVGPDREPEERPAPSTTGHLEQELDYARNSYRDALKRVEISNEELKSTNEELQSTNEELQSTNEELETSKEEMQSLNEELSTVNAELESKVGELSEANDDMENLLNNTDIATLFLDTELNIRRFNGQARVLVSLRATDLERPAFDLAWQVDNADLEADCRRVLETLATREREVLTRSGHNYLMRIVPYRTVENAVDGLVLTFVNIDRLTRARREATFFKAIVETVRHPMLVLDTALRIVSANASFCATFGLHSADLEGRHLYEVGGGRWDIPALRRLLEQVLPRERAFEEFEMTMGMPDMGRRHFLLSGRRLEGDGGEEEMILLALEARRGCKGDEP